MTSVIVFDVLDDVGSGVADNVYFLETQIIFPRDRKKKIDDVIKKTINSSESKRHIGFLVGFVHTFSAHPRMVAYARNCK